jgi:hypothetical protein
VLVQSPAQRSGDVSGKSLEMVDKLEICAANGHEPAQRLAKMAAGRSDRRRGRMAITPIYGSRPSTGGWQRATSFHPYEDMGINPNDAFEKNQRSISGGNDRAKSAAGGGGGGGAKPVAYGQAGQAGQAGGQARSPYQR